MEELNCQMVDFIDISKMIDSALEVSIEKAGYNQGGKNNNNYKNGISTYAQKKKSRCEVCGSTKNLMVHHKDGNRSNNSASNLKTLCWSDHEKITHRK